MTTNGLEQFAGQQFLNLETYRKNGQAMPTPVWFAEDNGVLYFRTVNGAGKVKRITNNPQVRVMPCQSQGEPLGTWVDADAQVITGAEADRALALLNTKYEIPMKTMQFPPEVATRGFAVIAVKLRA